MPTDQIWKIEFKPFDLVYNTYFGVGWITAKRFERGSYFYDVEWLQRPDHRKWNGLSHADVWNMKKSFQLYLENPKWNIE